MQAELRASSPGYAALTQPQPLSVAEIQSQVLDGKALLLEYALGAKRSFLWVVTPDAIESFELPGRERIEPVARRYYELVTARNAAADRREPRPAAKRRIDAADAEAERVGRELSRLILAPAARLLGDRPLLIVADGALQYIPFAALPISGIGRSPGHSPRGGQPPVGLGAGGAAARGPRPVPGTAEPWRSSRDPVFQATDERLTRPARPRSASSGSCPATRGARRPATAAGRRASASPSSRLPSSGKEARAIAALVPPGQRFLALGFEASRSRRPAPSSASFRNAPLRHPRRARQPPPGALEAGALALRRAGRRPRTASCRLNDIYNLHLDADLVVLSACRTALGQEIRGEGLVGLTRGFMYAGAARVLASLWSVEDRATAELMESSTAACSDRGSPPRPPCAGRSSRWPASPGRKSPYYWAGFSLQGEWR